MTEEFRLEINNAVQYAFDESYKKTYESSKALLRPYKLLVLEAIKAYNFFNEEYETDLLRERQDLVGSPSVIKIYNDTYAEFNNHYGKIVLTYDLSNKHRERVEPEFIVKKTFERKVIELFLKEEGIKVDFEKHDYEDYGQEEIVTITFDNDILLNLIKKYYEEVEKIQVEVQFSKYQDDPFIDIIPVISKEIVLGGIKLTGSEEVSMMKMTEIFNHYLPADYSFKKASFSIHKEYDRPGDYIEYVNTSVELEPVDQKMRERRF